MLPTSRWQLVRVLLVLIALAVLGPAGLALAGTAQGAAPPSPSPPPPATTAPGAAAVPAAETAAESGSDPQPTAAVRYAPPVDAPIRDPFRAPATPYGAGNRGIEFATNAGTAVRAAADGVITFAGSVAGSLVVTIRHADGIRTSYVGLATISVRAGERVARGDTIATTTERLHVGARRGDAYLDPGSLWVSGGEGGALLVPLDGGRRPP